MHIGPVVRSFVFEGSGVEAVAGGCGGWYAEHLVGANDRSLDTQLPSCVDLRGWDAEDVAVVLFDGEGARQDR